MRIDTAAWAVTVLSVIIPSVAAIPSYHDAAGEGTINHSIRGRRIPGRRGASAAAPGSVAARHNLVDGNRADAAAKQLLERATPPEKREASPIPAVGANGPVGNTDYTLFQRSKANPEVDSDPTYEISFLSKNEDDVVYEDEHPDGALRKRNPHQASCYDVPLFAVNGILGMYPAGGKCTHVRAGKRSVAITCYHSLDDDLDAYGHHSREEHNKEKRSSDDVHEDRRMQFLSLCDTNTRQELLAN